MSKLTLEIRRAMTTNNGSIYEILESEVIYDSRFERMKKEPESKEKIRKIDSLQKELFKLQNH
jgi:hypothetical protein